MLARLAKKAFPKSLWVYHCNSGACNGCDIEILNVLTPYYDVERFGIKLVASPRHADVMLISGAVTRPTLPLVKRAYEAIPEPKLVFGIGSCATGGGCWFDSYNVCGGAHTAVPVNYFIPGRSSTESRWRLGWWTRRSRPSSSSKWSSRSTPSRATRRGRSAT